MYTCDNCENGTAQRSVHTGVIVPGNPHIACNVDMSKYAGREFSNACATRFAASIVVPVPLTDAINTSRVAFVQLHGENVPYEVGMQTCIEHDKCASIPQQIDIAEATARRFPTGRIVLNWWPSSRSVSPEASC